jgi:hypothetical protein
VLELDRIVRVWGYDRSRKRRFAKCAGPTPTRLVGGATDGSRGKRAVQELGGVWAGVVTILWQRVFGLSSWGNDGRNIHCTLPRPAKSAAAMRREVWRFQRQAFRDSASGLPVNVTHRRVQAGLSGRAPLLAGRTRFRDTGPIRPGNIRQVLLSTV